GAVDAKGNKKSSSLKRNQFGGTAGGPIVKNRVFFFGGFQGTTIRADTSDNQAFVPTAAMLAGDFSSVLSAACGRNTTALRATDLADGSPTGFDVVTKKIDPSLFNSVALNLVKRLPKPQDDCGKVLYGSPTHQNDK